MSISERARVKVVPDEMPASDRPLSEEYRLASKEYVRAKSVAKLAEDLKPSKFAELMQKHHDLAVSRAELAVRASQEWKDHVASVVAACEDADLKRAKVKWIEMRHQEWVMQLSAAKHERQMGRQGT